MAPEREALVRIPRGFRRIDCLGKGRTGAVYLVETPSPKRLCVLKVLSSRYSAQALSCLIREVLVLKHLHHPRLCRVLEFVAAPDSPPYLLREFVPGRRLAPGPPPLQSEPRSFLQPVIDVLAALSFLHYNGIAHLDVHPGNVIERPDGRGVLIDAGVFPPSEPAGSRRESDPEFLLSSAFPAGAAPHRHQGVAADLFAAGQLLLYRLTGDTKGPSAFQAPAKWDKRLLIHLEHLVKRALRAEPAGGFASAEDFLNALCSVLGLTAGEVLGFGESYLFVGQKRAIGAAQALLSGLKHDQGGCLWVYGAGGSGKSRFLAEIRSRAEVEGIKTAAFRFYSEAPFSISSFCAVLPRGFPKMPAGSFREENPRSLARRFLQSAFAALSKGGEHLLITVDDFHHADSFGRSFIWALLECVSKSSSARLGVVVASNEKARSKAFPCCSLVPLSLRDSKQLLNQLTFPLKLADETRRRIVSLSRGSPALIQRFACSLKAGRIGGAGPPGYSDPEASSGVGRVGWRHIRGKKKEPDIENLLRENVDFSDNDARLILSFLSIFGRPVTIAELAKATGLRRAFLRDKLEQLRGLVGVGRSFVRNMPGFFLAGDSIRDEILNGLSYRAKRSMHLACAGAIRSLKPKRAEALLLADMVRHYALGGKTSLAASLLPQALDALAAEGNASAACRLAFLVFNEGKRRKLDLALRISDLARRSGQNELAFSALSDVLPKARRRERLEILKRLGVHAFRMGSEKKACRFLRKVLARADPKRDLDIVVETNAELADVLISRGDFSQAERICSQGLELLSGLREKDSKAACESEVTLRAISGRLHLRRLELGKAVRDLKHALRCARELEDIRPRALILNNLGVAYNQLNDFRRARRTFAAAERLSQRLGHAEALVHIWCNLALIAAKTDQGTEAVKYLEKARAEVERLRSERLQFLTAQAESVVFLLLGFPERAESAAASAIRLGKKTGEFAHVRFLQLYRAEALIEMARYSEAEKELRSLLGAEEVGAVVKRMAKVRYAYVLSLVGRTTEAQRILHKLAEEAGSGITYLEAWNEYFHGQARENSGLDGRTQLTRAFEVFRDLGIPIGRIRSGAALLSAAVRRCDEHSARMLVHQMESCQRSPHAMLDVEVPAACAEACLFLGEVERARHHLLAAGGAIVGKRFPELDLRLEILWAEYAAASGDIPSARRHVHRALALRLHLSERLPEGRRDDFLRQARWKDLTGLQQRFFEPARPAERPAPRATFGIVARSPAMREVVDQIQRLGPQDLCVLIRGPTGSGKELVARALHQASPRSERAFVAVHLPSLPEELFESELFGHVKGAFTGAERDRAGLLQNADRGTVLFDEIAALSLPLQAKLLRVIDRREMRPVGGSAAYSIDIRFLFTSSKDLRTLVSQGVFREDLYWRIAQAEIVVPPLERRKEDIPDLIALILRKHAHMVRRSPEIGPGVLDFLSGRKWPGNVRQLETVLIRALLSCGVEARLTVELLKSVLSSPTYDGSIPEEFLESDDLDSLRRELEIAWIKKRFLEAGGSISALARRLNLSRPSLYAWLKRLGVDIAGWREELRK